MLLTSALQRGSVTTATAGIVIGETIGPAAVGVIWLGDRTREGLTWLAALASPWRWRERWRWRGSGRRR
jgi:hypothetical protein